MLALEARALTSGSAGAVINSAPTPAPAAAPASRIIGQLAVLRATRTKRLSAGAKRWVGEERWVGRARTERAIS